MKIKKINILFIYGFNNMPESKFLNELKKSLPKKYNIFCDYYAQYNPVEALKDLNNYIEKNNIEIIIADNIGGYLSKFIDNRIEKKILINPIINVLDDFNKINESNNKETFIAEHIYKFYSEFEDNLPTIYDKNIYYINTNKDEDIIEKIKEILKV